MTTPTDDGAAIMRAANACCEQFDEFAAQLVDAGYLPEMVIQATLYIAATHGQRFGYCADALREYLGSFVAAGEVASLKCPHCGPAAVARRS